LGLLSRHRQGSVEQSSGGNDASKELALKLDELDGKLKTLASHQESLDKSVQQAPRPSDYGFLTSEIARLQGELERMDTKHKEGILTLYSQIYKELKAIRGDRVIQMIDVEPVTNEKLEKVSDQLSRLAKAWREMKPPPVNEPGSPL
jgi:hypothetical protein